ncbi:MAG: radical SAM protein [Candidatus Omnitrophica bacterium]|nr:radical SAM protein [Candidatus Omnitrophota bacterium]
MKVLIINEPYVKDFCRTQRWAARTRGRVLRAPDWLAYAAAVCERDGLEVGLRDLVAEGKNKDDLRAVVRSLRPDFVVLDSTTPSVYSDLECARIVKEESGAVVIMVGPHASVLPEETLLAAQGAVDVVCIGEYDYTVSEVVRHTGDLARVKGIAYYRGGEVFTTPRRPLIENLDELPFPAWHHLDLMKYFDGGKLYPYIDIISGRGCPNRCSFCLWPQAMHGFQYRFRSPGNVLAEIERDISLLPQVLKGGEFFFEDDTFTVHKERAAAICGELMRRKRGITFSVNARVDTADAELFGLMKRAGCRELLVGFESGSQKVLDAVHKNITLRQSRRFMELARAAGLSVHGCFVIGLPQETETTAQETIDFALSLGCETLQFSGAVPFPGTEFFRLCQEEGWLQTRDWSRWLSSGEQQGVISYPQIRNERINYYVDKGLKDFYLRPSYMLKFLFATRSRADLYRKMRGARNFLGYLLHRG